MNPNENLVVPVFKIHTVQNEARSRDKGRPQFDDLEIVEIRMAGNKQTVGVFPAHEVWKWEDKPDGSREPVTYAMRWPDIYQKFKANEAQVQSGTPLSEAPFLTQAKRYELKALNIHTVEALAALDGTPLKTLGIGGREMKTQAQAYLAKAEGSAVETRLAAENEDLRQQLADLQTQFSEFSKSKPSKAKRTEIEDEQPDASEDAAMDEDGTDGSTSPFSEWDDEDLKNWIADAQGSRPKGNPNHATLVRMADEINAELAKKNEGN